MKVLVLSVEAATRETRIVRARVLDADAHVGCVGQVVNCAGLKLFRCSLHQTVSRLRPDEPIREVWDLSEWDNLTGTSTEALAAAMREAIAALDAPANVIRFPESDANPDRRA